MVHLSVMSSSGDITEGVSFILGRFENKKRKETKIVKNNSKKKNKHL